MLIQCNYAQCSNTWQTARLPTFLMMVRVKGILGLVLHEDVNLFRVIGRCEFGLCEDLNSMKRHSIIDYFALILWRSFPSDGISMLFTSLILMSASCQAPVLKITCWRCGALTIIAIVYLDTSHWSLVSLNRYTSLYFDFSGNTERASS